MGASENHPDDTHADGLPLRELIREDYVSHGRRPTEPGLHAIVVHRIGRRTLGSRRLRDRVTHKVANVLFVAVRNVYGIELGFPVEVGRRVKIAHQGMIVVNDASRIGNDCLIRHGVTLGAPDDERANEAPELRAGVEVGVNAVIVGAVVIGEGARVGPLALVFEDLPPGARALGTPARVRRVTPRVS